MATNMGRQRRKTQVRIARPEALEARELLAIDLTTYALPMILQSNPTSIAKGPDGNLWFTESQASKIAQVTPSGTVKEFAVPVPLGTTLDSIVSGPQGALWFTEAGVDSTGNPVDKIARITTDGKVTEFPVESGANIASLAAGSDGALWFTENLFSSGTGATERVGRMTTDGKIATFAVPGATGPFGRIVAGPDGNLWFAESADYQSSRSAKLVRMTTAGVATEFGLPGLNSSIATLTAGPDGNVWFGSSSYGTTSSNQIGKITSTGQITQYALPNDSIIPGVGISAMSPGGDGNVWYTQAGQVGKVTPSGKITTAKLPASNSYNSVEGLALGSDGNVWYTSSDFSNTTIGKVTPDLKVTSFPVAPSFTTDPAHGISVYPDHIVRGTDGGLWFSTNGYIGGMEIRRIGIDGQVKTFPIASSVTTPTTSAYLVSIAAGTNGDTWFAAATNSLTGAGGGLIGRLTSAGVISTYKLPAGFTPDGLTTTADGRAWATLSDGKHGKIVRVDASGVMKSFAMPVGFLPSGSLVAAPSGRLWFSTSREVKVKKTSVTVGSVASFDTNNGRFAAFTLPKAPNYGSPVPLASGTAPPPPPTPATSAPSSPNSPPASALFPFRNQKYYQADALAIGPDGNLWITASGNGSHKIIRMTPQGRMTTFDSPGNSQSSSITAGPDGNLWFTENLSFSPPIAARVIGPPGLIYPLFGQVGRITPTGVATSFPLSAGLRTVSSIVAGPDGKLWITDSSMSRIASFTPPPLFVGAISSSNVVGLSTTATNTSRPSFSGVAHALANVTLYASKPDLATLPIGSTRADAQGRWSLKTSQPLPDGSYQIYGGETGPGDMFLASPVLISPSAASTPLIIDTTGARVTFYSYDAKAHQIALTFNDAGAGFAVPTDGSSYTPILSDVGSYQVTADGSKAPLGFSANVVAGSTSTKATVLLTLTSSAVPKGPLTLTVVSKNLTDQAGNALDGEYRGRLPSGDGRPGGDFVVKLNT